MQFIKKLNSIKPKQEPKRIKMNINEAKHILKENGFICEQNDLDDKIYDWLNSTFEYEDGCVGFSDETYEIWDNINQFLNNNSSKEIVSGYRDKIDKDVSLEKFAKIVYNQLETYMSLD